MSSSFKIHWSHIRVKDVSPNSYVNNLSIYSRYLVMSPSKTPLPRAFGQLLRVAQRKGNSLPLYDEQDSVSLFPQMGKLAGLGWVTYTTSRKNVMLFISRHQKLANVIFRCTTFSPLVHAPCKLKPTIVLKLASSMPACTSSWRRS